MPPCNQSQLPHSSTTRWQHATLIGTPPLLVALSDPPGGAHLLPGQQVREAHDCARGILAHFVEVAVQVHP